MTVLGEVQRTISKPNDAVNVGAVGVGCQTTPSAVSHVIRDSGKRYSRTTKLSPPQLRLAVGYLFLASRFLARVQ